MLHCKNNGIIFNGEEDVTKDLVNELKDKILSDKHGVTVDSGDDTYFTLDNGSDNNVHLNLEPIGAGSIAVKLSTGKKGGEQVLKVSVELKADLTKDYEIIPYQDGDANEQGISDFLKQWVRKDYILGENSVGVEVNFNKVFYKPVVLRPTSEIAAEIRALDLEINALEKDLW